MADVTEPSGRSPETTDRLMVGVCGAIWLVWLAVASIATVALVQMGRGHRADAGESGSSWLLYTIIVISALVIIGAIPLLIRARQAAMAAAGAGGGGSEPAESPQKAAEPLPTSPAAEAPTEKLRVFGAAVDPYRRKPAAQRVVSRINVVLERIFLRGTASLLGAMGLALIAVEVATYLLATHTDTAAWVALGLAGVLTVGMVAVFLNLQRRLGSAADEAADHALA